MVKKPVKLILISFLLSALLLGGCWDVQDIEERSIATLVALDKTEDGYRFFVEFAEPSGGGSESAGGSKYVYHQGKGKNFAEARAALDNKAKNPIYLGAVNAVVVTKRMAYYGIKEYMYRLREINDYRKVVDIFVIDCEPEELALLGKGETSVGKTIEDTMKTLVKSGGRMYDRSNLGFILESLASPCKSFLLPCVSIKENSIAVAGFYVFNDGVCVGVLGAEESWGMQLFNQKKSERYYTAPIGGDEATVRLTLKKKKVEPSFENGRIGFLISVEFYAVLAYVTEEIEFDAQLTEELKRNLEHRIAEDIARAVYDSQKVYRTDYMSFCIPFRIKYPVEFREMDWHGAFPDADITIEVAVNLDVEGEPDFIPQYEF